MFERVKSPIHKLHIYDSLRSIQVRSVQCRICYVLTEFHRRRHGTVSLCGGKDEVCCLEEQWIGDWLDITTDFGLPESLFPKGLVVWFLNSRDTCKNWQDDRSENCGRHDGYYIDESQETIDEQIRLRAGKVSIILRTETESIINLKDREHQTNTFEVVFEGPRWSLNPYEDRSTTTSTTIECQGWKLEEPHTTTSDDPVFTIQLDASSPNSTNLDLSLNHFSTTDSSYINFPCLQDWIVSCERTHPRCNRSVKPSNNSEERDKIRCIDVNSLQIVPLTIWERYVALSYVREYTKNDLLSY